MLCAIASAFSFNDVNVVSVALRPWSNARRYATRSGMDSVIVRKPAWLT